MPKHLHNTRRLYLLALFQLVGGPLVLLPVLLFSKLSVKHVAEHGLTAGITQAWHSEEWQDAVDEVLQGEAGLPATQKDKLPPQTKETKAKLFATELDRPATAPGRWAATGLLPWSRLHETAATRPHAPPSPPPRWV